MRSRSPRWRAPAAPIRAPARRPLWTPPASSRRGARCCTARPKVRPRGRSREWTRVELQGWVKSADLQTAPPGVLVGVSAAELRADPQRYLGQMLRWTVQFISLQQADELRPEMPFGATYFLARGPLPERGFVYVVVPESKRAAFESVTPLATLQVTARVRSGRTRFLGNPVLDLTSFEALP